MNRLAHVLVVSGDARRSGPLMSSLSANRCEALLCEGAEGFLAHARTDQPDLAIIDVASLGEAGFDAAQAMRTGTTTAHVPLILIAGVANAAACERALEIGVDDIIAEPFRQEELIYRMRPLLRLSTMHAEMNRRTMLAREFGVPLPPAAKEPAEAPCRLLVVGDSLDLPCHVTTAMSERSCEVVTCDAVVEAESVLSDGAAFGACLLRVPPDAEHAPFPYLTFCNRVRDNPRLFNLPLVVVAPAGFFDTIDALFLRHGATRVLPERVAPEVLRFVLLSLDARQRKRWALRAALESTRRPPAQDPLSGTYTFAFLQAHVAKLIESARTWRKHLSVVFLSFPNLPQIRKHFGDAAADHLVQQLAQWSGVLIRAEDMVARHGEQDFYVALPDTPLKEAKTVMHRVASVISYTDFAVPDVFQPLSVWVELGMAELQPDDTADGLIERARSHLEMATTPTT